MAITQNQLAPAPQSVEAKLAAALAELAALKAPKAISGTVAMKTYHSSVPFIRMLIMRSPGNCEPVQFVGGKLTTDDAAVQTAVEAAIRSGGSGFSFAPVSGVPAEVLEMRTDVRRSAEIAQTKAVAAGLSTS